MRLPAVILVVCVAACATEDPVSPTVPVATTIEAVSGGGKVAVFATTLPDPLVVHVKDQFGAAFVGAVVTFSVSGTVTLNRYSVITNASGNAQVTFSFGNRAGVDTVMATVSGVTTPALFIEKANPGIPASLTVLSGDGQSGQAGVPLPNDLVVVVRDLVGNPLPAIAIVWRSATGQPGVTANGTGPDGTSHLTFTPAAGVNTVNVSVDYSSLVTAFTATGN